MTTQVESGFPASARPTGTVTFLFSDIEGSTSRWERAPEAMAPALERHDALVRSAIEAHNGFVFKTFGDAFCAAFATAPDAIAAALDGQRVLRAEDFSAVDGILVRMALHSGHSTERGGDYFGPAVNRVARLLAVGHGGQVLLSVTTRDLAQGALPSDVSFRDLGSHKLKDLALSEHVYQLVAPDLRDEFPPLRSLDVLPNNLPAQLTSFVGRESVAAEIKELIASHRLVTLAGTGGAGKTRCAIQVGAELLDGSGEGVWIAELARISDPENVVNIIARALNVQDQPNRPILDTLLAYLRRKRLLLILDNCEHLIQEVCRVVGAIMRDCPEVHILATSREPLNIFGEEAYRMPSLDVPSKSDPISLEKASRYGAVQLFVERALSSDKRFSLTDENVAHVAEICRRLDGIPLAIELAAARVRVLSPQQIARKLDERFRLLTGGDRSALPRQQTMRASIDWSYDLLSDNERMLFRRLSIFVGGFTLETATAVCAESDMDEIVVLDLLSSLVDKSLLQAEVEVGVTRYLHLESTRQYAREKLTDAGEQHAVTYRHARTFLALAEQLDVAWQTTADRAWFAQAQPELENFRAALSWAFGAGGDLLLGQRLVGVLRLVWVSFSTAEGLRWVHAAQEQAADAPASVLAGIDMAEAILAAQLAYHKESLRAAERALAYFGEVGDPLGRVEAQLWIHRAQVYLGEVAEGDTRMEQVLEEARSLGARKLVVLALQRLAFARVPAGDLAGARRLYREALAVAREAGAERLAAMLAVNLAESEFEGGDAAIAVQYAGEALAVFRTFNHTLGVGMAQRNAAAYLVTLHRYEEARNAARESLTNALNTQNSAGAAFSMQHLAAIAALRANGDAPVVEDCRRAARILGYVDARLSELESSREYTEQQEYDAMLHALRAVLGENELSSLTAEGSTWSEDHTAAEAMLV